MTSATRQTPRAHQVPGAGRAGTYHSTQWPLWGTTVHLVLAADAVDEARRHAVSILDAIDRTCSRFRDDSDLARVNAGAGHWVDVDPLLVRVVRAALRAAAATQGLVDPTLGAVLRSWGYDADFDRLETASLDPADLRPGVAVDIQSVDDPPLDPIGLGGAAPDLAQPGHLGRSWRAVDTDDGLVSGDARIRVPVGVALDLGAVGKAYAVDAVAAALGGAGIPGIVGIGGDVAVTSAVATQAVTTQAVTPAGSDHQWRVDISEVPGGEVQQRLLITRGGLATSATSHRRWRHRGRIAHHIIDPRTGRPATEVWRTVSVAAASAVDANTATTAAIVIGDGAPDWLDGFELAARLVAADGTVVTTGGWPGQEPA